MMQSLDSIEKIAKYLEQIGERLKPLDLDNVKQIEQKYQCVFPKVYKQFLLLMGSGAGNYMMGSSVFFNEIFFLKKWAEEMIQENNLDPLPEKAFVFWMHQGYQAAYFNLDEGDDPPVYFFSEGQKNLKFELKERTLSKFFFYQLLTSYPELTENN